MSAQPLRYHMYVLDTQHENELHARGGVSECCSNPSTDSLSLY